MATECEQEHCAFQGTKLNSDEVKLSLATGVLTQSHHV